MDEYCRKFFDSRQSFIDKCRKLSGETHKEPNLANKQPKDQPKDQPKEQQDEQKLNQANDQPNDQPKEQIKRVPAAEQKNIEKTFYEEVKDCLVAIRAYRDPAEIDANKIKWVAKDNSVNPPICVTFEMQKVTHEVYMLIVTDGNFRGRYSWALQELCTIFKLEWTGRVPEGGDYEKRRRYLQRLEARRMEIDALRQNAERQIDAFQRGARRVLDF